MVEPLRNTTTEYKKVVLKKVGYNPFLIKSDNVFIGLLTYSETGSMSEEQWTDMITGDQKQLIPVKNELVRLAIPRRVHMQSHIDYVLDVFDDILESHNRKHGYTIVYEPPFFEAYHHNIRTYCINKT